MSPLRWDVLAVAFVLAIPLLALGLRGDFEWPDVVSRLPWCLLAAWGAVALLRWASQPRGTAAGGTGKGAPGKGAPGKGAPGKEKPAEDPAPAR